MAAQYGGVWYAGRRPADYRNTYDFVCRQHDLVQACVDLRLTDELSDDVMYNLAATMQKRFRSEKEVTINLDPKSAAVNQAMLQLEVQQAGMEARLSGQSFSACGSTLNGGGFEEAGFGNKTNETTSYSFDKKMHCVVCQKEPSQKEAKKMCGPCGICRDCDKKLGGKA